MPTDEAQLPLECLELAVGGIRVVSVVFSIVVYSREPFRAHGDTLVGLQNRFWRLCDQQRPWFYATENMSRHKAVTSRTLDMLATWTKPTAPEREFVSLEIKDGEVFNAAPRFKFQVQGTEPGSPSYDDGDANLLKINFPADWARSRKAEMRELALEVFSAIPVVSGHAGYAFELSRYYQAGAEAHAWRHSMRHRGFDILRTPEDRRAVATDGLKGVGWLTLLGPALAQDVGGAAGIRRGMPRSVAVEELKAGVACQAGEQAQMGDLSTKGDLSDYKAVFRRMRPLIERTAARYPALWVMGGLNSERTEDWLYRLERDGAGA